MGNIIRFCEVILKRIYLEFISIYYKNFRVLFRNKKGNERYLVKKKGFYFF